MCIYKKNYKQGGNDTYQISIGNKQKDVNNMITVFLATRIDIRIFKMFVPSVCLLLVMLAGRAEAHWQVMAHGQYLFFVYINKVVRAILLNVEAILTERICSGAILPDTGSSISIIRTDVAFRTQDHHSSTDFPQSL